MHTPRRPATRRRPGADGGARGCPGVVSLIPALPAPIVRSPGSDPHPVPGEGPRLRRPTRGGAPATPTPPGEVTLPGSRKGAPPDAPRRRVSSGHRATGSEPFPWQRDRPTHTWPPPTGVGHDGPRVAGLQVPGHSRRPTRTCTQLHPTIVDGLSTVDRLAVNWNPGSLTAGRDIRSGHSDRSPDCAPCHGRHRDRPLQTATGTNGQWQHTDHRRRPLRR